ncbi:MAG TPA: diphthamide biosynthesis enzyme Dph2 [Methanoculleus sp.]|nr:diphthamide biosynthesis enzyme Dph2 [Methanoculleus sp.]
MSPDLEFTSPEAISDLVRKIRGRNGDRVALQFPEGLKRKAASVARALAAAGIGVVISGDPCYGACDLDLDLLGETDLLVHFGHAPVDEREGVLYVHAPYDFDVSVLDAALPLLEGTEIGLVTTVQHAHLVDAAASYLQTLGISCAVAQGSARTPLPGQILGCSFEAARATGAREILFVGTGVFHALGVQLATGARVVALDPYRGSAEAVDASRLLRKRHVLIEKAREAESIGILLSKKSGQKRGALATRLAALSDAAFIVALQEITPDTLLNLGFDCYVNTACPRLAYDDQVRFPAPVLSPPEFEISCGVRSWEDYTIDEIV